MALPTGFGDHEKVSIYDVDTFMDNGYGMRVPFDLWVGLLDPSHVGKQWKKLDTIEEAPVEPAIVMTGLVSWVN